MLTIYEKLVEPAIELKVNSIRECKIRMRLYNYSEHIRLKFNIFFFFFIEKLSLALGNIVLF